MRRIFALLITLLIPVLIIGAVALMTYKPGPPDMAQNVLNRYLVHLRQTGHPATAVATQAASYPRSLTAALSGPTYGDAIYYALLSLGLDTPTAMRVPTVTSMWGPGSSITYSAHITPDVGYGYSGGRPLPYPPEEIWCVQLQPEGTAPPQMVLLALHQDLYNASWAVHELPPATTAQTLALVGCAIK